jgi:hypothetical protein
LGTGTIFRVDRVFEPVFFSDRERRGGAEEFEGRTRHTKAKGTSMAKKQSTPKVSTLASKVLSGQKQPTKTDAKTLAASVLSQDEKKGQGKRR